MKSKSKYVRKEACPQCNSKDNMAVFDDGHTHCFGCGYQFQPSSKKEKEFRPMPSAAKPKVELIKFVTPKALPKRGITEETAKLFDYGYAEYRGQPVQVATYRDQHNRPTAQHVRFRDKRFVWLADDGINNLQLWRQDLWRQNHGKVSNTFAVITEGEIDCMTVSQVQGNRFPVVSLPSGAQSANKYIAANLKWLSQFVRVVICFDSDEPGMAAAEKALEVLPLGKAAICRLPRKDANEMLLAGEGEELRDLLWKAQPARPDSILPAAGLWEELIKPGATAVCQYPWPELDNYTKGYRKGEMLTFCAGSGTGKSTICRELAHHFLKEGLRVGYIALEESVQRTLQGIIGVEISKPLHLQPDCISEEELKKAFDRLTGSNRLFLYDHFGSIDPDRLIEQIQYLATAENVDVVILDHLTIVISGLIGDLDERKALDVTCTKLRQVVESTGVGLIIVSHLKRPEGKGHEEGTQVSLSHLRSSHSVAQLSDLVIAAERNQQGDPAEKSSLQLRVLKNRFSGSTGPVDKLLYDQNSGRLLTHLFL